jgi:pimeloyl-ACP methyl ester carboxylesterase
MTPVARILLLSLLWQAPDVTGSWEGPVETFAGKIRVRIHVTRQPDGTLAGTMDSVDQGAFGIPLDSVSFADGVLRWEKKAIMAVYTGKLSADGQSIEGKLNQGMELPLTFRRMDKPPERPRRPQEPKPPFPYTEEEVTIPNEKAGVRLSGTLTVPAGKGPHPAVVLISGSGPQNRDEEIMGHKPFLVLADHLTRSAIAVLRYDDRGFGKSTGQFGTATSADFASDAESAFEFLKGRKEIDAKRIGLAGHSEGAIIAPMIAARRADVAFIVLMAGTAVTGEEVLYAQGRAIALASGAPESAAAQQNQIQKKMFDIVKSGNDPAEAEKKLRAAFGESKAMEAQIRQVNGPWFRYFLTYDPAPALAKVRCPVLAVNGEKDVQVLPDQNLPAIEAALKKGGNTDFRIVRLPGLNHLFQTAKTGSPQEYAVIEETMAPAALETVSAWIREKAGLK